MRMDDGEDRWMDSEDRRTETVRMDGQRGWEAVEMDRWWG